ncbi:GDSL esterase/lipase APG-like [Triticum dicoccoides]|uniref:GDSL esterase/lipase APG-like n=1 Tax=Triticum dicoccoides TaxID=85692 RepID=UPI000E7B9237|nr:GDSL esterase/lipase APG-like [Triticum dicoccoides]
MLPSRSSSPAMQRMIALVALSLLLSCGVHGQVVPAVISFGDSTIDVGNNNYLPGAVFKANYAPYGENFRRHKATGRFSDGKIVTDITAETLGFEGYAPPYLSPLASGKNLLTGANFGSAASSYSDDTAAMYDAITLSQQLKYYKEYRSKLAAVAGRRQARTILAEALYVVSTGTGDFIQNYYHNASLSARYDVDRYCDLLVGIFSCFDDELYRLGARRIGVTTMPPLGCLPATIRLYGGKGRSGGGGCLPRLNRDAETFNRKLNATVGALVRRHAGLKVAVFDVYTPLRDLSERPAAQGFAEARRTCCRTGKAGTGVYLCDPATTAAGMCRNASSYVYFDGVHPSEAANLVVAESLVSAGIDLLT